jgi:hypothetical protein
METIRFDTVAGSDMDRAMKIIRFRLGTTPVKFKIVPWYQNRQRGSLQAAMLFAEPNEIIMVADKRGDVAQTPIFRGYLDNSDTASVSFASQCEEE